MTNAAAIIVGPWSVTIGSTLIGHTEDGIQEGSEDAADRIFTHESGKVPVRIVYRPTPNTFTIKAVEINVASLTLAFPNATVSSVGLATLTDVTAKDLVGVKLTLHPLTVTGTASDTVYEKVAIIGAVRNNALKAGGKYGLDIIGERLFNDSGTIATVGGVA